MSNKTNLVGKQFGKLTVIEEADNMGKYTAWKCQCSCGNIKIIKSIYLTLGDTTSCGCFYYDQYKQKRIEYANKVLNQKFGMLTPINIANLEEFKKPIAVICRCDCGNITTKRVNSILLGVKSCSSKKCTSKMLSVSRGGSGIPYEYHNIQQTVRNKPEYRIWVNECLKTANYKCNITNCNTNRLEVHHLNSISYLVDLYNITKDTLDNFKNILYDINNAVVLRRDIHREFHKIYGSLTTKEQYEEFKNKRALTQGSNKKI